MSIVIYSLVKKSFNLIRKWAEKLARSSDKKFSTPNKKLKKKIPDLEKNINKKLLLAY